MKRLIRIIFLLVLIQYIIAESCGKKEGVCVGEDLDPKYLCVESGDTCEKKLLCESVEKEGSETIDCTNYPVQTANKETHTCLANPRTEADSTPCKEIEFCSKITTGDLKDEECRTHPISERENKADYVCVAKTEGGCEEQLSCEKRTKSEGETCSSFPTQDEKKACTDGEGNECKEVFLCEKADSGENDEQCSKYIAKDEYVCQQNKERSDADPLCKEVHTCNYADKDGKVLSSEVCSGYPISLENKDTHICLYNEKDKKCYEEVLCEKVTLDGDKKCSDYPVKKENEKTHVCINNDEKENTCKEIEICSAMGDKKKVTDEECRKHPVYENNSPKDGYICEAKSEGGCGEKQLCPTTEGSLKEGECSDYASSDSKKICRVDKEKEKACAEVFLCEKADSGENDEQCSKYIANDEYICQQNKERSDADPLCKEVHTCNFADKDSKELSSEVCSKYPISLENKNTHACFYNEKDTKCYEQILCEKAKKEGDEQIVCSNYPVATEKKDTHGCVTNPNPSTEEGSTPCIEKDFCSKITEGTLTEELCKTYPISNRENKEDYICVPKSGGGCEEKLSCEKVTELGENEKCSDYPSSTENKVCTEGESTKCKEEFLCGKDESTKELTDSICNKYPVSKDNKDTHICSYNSESKKCDEQFLCESVSKDGNDSKDCPKYPVKLENKETHVCIANNGGTTLCKEIELCSAMTEGTLSADECGTHPISEKENKADYICVPKLLGGCEEKLDCEKVTKLAEDEKCSDFPTSNIAETGCVENDDASSEKKCKPEKLCSTVKKEGEAELVCKNYPVSFVTRYDHYCDLEGEACAEKQSLCGDVTQKTKDCFSYYVSEENKGDYGCINILGGQGCKEAKKCEKVEKIEENDNCNNYAPDKEGSLCVENEKTGESEPLCKSVPTCNYAEGTDGNELSAEVCSKYQISLENKDTHVCLFNEETKKCYEEFLCDNVELNGDKKCSDYPVKKDNEKTHVCINNSEKENTCKEIEICSAMETKKDVTDEECRKHPVYESNAPKDGYICVKNSEGDGCEEKQICSSLSELKEGEKCTNFPSSDINKACLENTGEDKDNKPCKEEFLCEKADSGDTDDQCMNYIVSDESKFMCLKNPEKSGSSLCKEIQKCETVTGEKLTDSECNKYAVSQDNKATHICIYNPKEKKCFEQILCENVQSSKEKTTEINCSDYPVKLENSATHICVKNPKEGNYCIEEKLNPIPTTIKEPEKTSITTTISQENEKITTITTSLNKKETTSITNALTTIIQETNEETSVVFLGCSKFKMASSYFTFSIHFIPLIFSFISKILTFPMTVIYDTYLRHLEDYNANCNLDETNTQSMLSYLCEVQAPTANIKNIKVNPEFNFGNGKVSLAGITPLAKMSMNDLKKVGDKYDSLFSSNPSIYILDNSTVNRYTLYKFNISGTINGEKPEKIFVNQNLSLMINNENNETETETESEEDETTKEINCTVKDIINKNYTLDCETNDKKEYDLQSAMSIIEEGILLVNFGNGSQAAYYPDSDSEVSGARYHFKKSKGIGAGGIVAIVLASVAVLAALIGTIYYLRKSPKNTNNNETTEFAIKNSN